LIRRRIARLLSTISTPNATTDPSVHSTASRRDLPRAEGTARMAEYFAELRAKRSTYLFLPRSSS
jgi:hypothetical protein